jgi:ABC-2 type transport system ATP-binding protein
MPPIIEVANLSKTYGPLTAVRDISFQVEQGEIFGILGPNGAGKTTTVECVQGLREPDAGEIAILGFDARRQRNQLRGRIGAQLQESALPDRIKVREALDLFASLSGSPVDYRDLMDAWGLTPRANASYVSLSGGQKQRLFIALALINDPQVVFLDELTQGLDPDARRLTWDLIRSVRDRGATIVLVTHYMDEAEQLCDRLAVINDGVIIGEGTPQALVANTGAGLRVRFSANVDDLGWLRQVPHVESVRRHGSHVEVHGSGPVLAFVAAALVERGIVPDDLRLVQPTLEDAYFGLLEPVPVGAQLAKDRADGARAEADLDRD